MSDTHCRKRRQNRRCKLPAQHLGEHDFETVEEHRARREVADREMEAQPKAWEDRTAAELAPVVRQHWPFIPDAIIRNLVVHGAHPTDDYERLRRHVENAARHVSTNYEELLPPRWKPRAYATLREKVRDVVEEILAEWELGRDE